MQTAGSNQERDREITVRVMQREDIPVITAIEKRIFSTPWSEKSFLDAFSSADNIYLVSLLGKEIAGYCGIWISYEVADLCNIAVVPEYRRQGIGEKLLQEAIYCTKGRKAERILLEVRESNQGAMFLYQKIGFEKIGVRRGYYSAPREDAILMQLSLSQ